MSCATAMARSIGSRLLPSLRSAPVRLSLAALALLMPAAALFAIFIGSQVNQLLADQTLEILRAELRDLRSQFDRGGLQQLANAVAERSVGQSQNFYRLDHDGGDGGALAGNLPERPQGISTAGGIFSFREAVAGVAHTAVGIAVPVSPEASLVVARTIDDQRAFAAYLQRLAFAGIGLLTLMSLGFGWWSSRRLSSRVADVTTTARSIMEGDFNLRIPVDGSGDEFDELASSLNAMLARIEDLMQALREVSDNIAHDLKTPLTRLRNRAEAALREQASSAHREGLERVIEEADSLIQTFNALLLIARLEAGAIDATRIDCDLAEVVRDVAELYQPVADDAGLELVIEAAHRVPAFVNRQLVGQAVANMIDNAIKYSRGAAGTGEGPVVVTVARMPDGSIEISVADRGPGIPTSDRERATKRFVRLEQSRSQPGTGLGLSLVAAVARLHGGKIRLEDNSPGLRIVFALPLSVHGTAAIPQAGGPNVARPTEAVARSLLHRSSGGP